MSSVSSAAEADEAPVLEDVPKEPIKRDHLAQGVRSA